MNAVRNRCALRIAAALVALLGWLVLANHCALSTAMSGRQEAAQAETDAGCCHKKGPAPENLPVCPEMPQGCCKTLHALVPDAAKMPAAQSSDMALLPVLWVIVLHAQLPAFSGSVGDTGPPPDVPAFAELVLHRSLRAHAPPVLA